LEFNKDAKELTFPVTTDPASPAGKHKNILCRVTIIENGEEIVSTAGTVEIQIDQPLPAPAKPAPMPAAAAAAPAEQPKPAPVVAKPLTRLEKLRLAAEERKKAKAAGQDGGQ
jgi:hypothetical protein